MDMHDVHEVPDQPQRSRFQKGKTAPPEDAPPMDPGEFVSQAMDSERRSAWGRPGPYEVPELTLQQERDDTL